MSQNTLEQDNIVAAVQTILYKNPFRKAALEDEFKKSKNKEAGFFVAIYSLSKLFSFVEVGGSILKYDYASSWNGGEFYQKKIADSLPYLEDKHLYMYFDDKVPRALIYNTETSTYSFVELRRKSNSANVLFELKITGELTGAAVGAMLSKYIYVHRR